jgi:hypothetical protein
LTTLSSRLEEIEQENTQLKEKISRYEQMHGSASDEASKPKRRSLRGMAK